MSIKKPADRARSSYQRAISAAVVEHARYLAVQGELHVTQHLIDRRRDEWLRTEARRQRLRGCDDSAQ